MKDHLREKIRLIEIINQHLIDDRNEPLSPREFDVLYDLDLEDLTHVKNKVKEHLTVEK